MSTIILNIPGERTALYPISQERVKELDRIISDKLMKWRMFHAKWKLHVTDFYRKEINYEGVKYEGSPQLVFWSNFTEPFLENCITDILNKTYRECQNRNLNPDEYLKEASDLLKALTRKVFKEMSRVDQVLRGNGYPDSVKPREVTGKIAKMDQFINAHLKAIIHRGDENSEKNHEELATLGERNHPLSAEGILIKNEFKRRLDSSNTIRWYAKPAGLVLIGVVASLLACALWFLYGPH